MAKTNNLGEYLLEFKESFGENHPGAVDIDCFMDKLDEIISSINQAQSLFLEKEFFRDDYLIRISGMLKAIAVAAKNDDEMQIVIDEIDALQNLSAEALVAKYKKVQTRFRSAFPATFGLVAGQATSSKIRNYKNYQ